MRRGPETKADRPTNSPQRRPSLSALPGAGVTQTVCAGCYETTTSVLSLAGQCSVCGAPLCYKCWGTGQRTCVEHGIETPVADTPRAYQPTQTPAGSRRKAAIGKKGAAHVRCRRCGTETRRKGFVLGREVYCLKCQEERTRIPSELPEGAVPIDAARYLEVLFHRFAADGLQKAAESNRGLLFRGKASQSGEAGARAGRPVACGAGSLPAHST